MIANSTAATLAAMLGLRPLDRVQLNDPHAIREMRTGAHFGDQQAELPFMYFQRVRPDGLLELRSPGGYMTTASAADICDVVPGEPVLVRAMTPTAFLSRTKLSHVERQPAPGPECYAKAHVLYVMKDRWGRVDQIFVWFVDPAHNGDKPKAAPLHQDDRARLANVRRTAMPVSSNYAGNSSADHGLIGPADTARRATTLFMQAALKGERELVSTLASAGMVTMKNAQLNRLRSGMAS